MQSYSLLQRPLARLVCLLALGSAAAGCAPATDSTTLSTAPVVYRWPDPAFLPDAQCQGGYTVAELQTYLPLAEVALQLPGTRAVALDQQSRCLTVIVDGFGSGRMAELLLRGMAVPRTAVLLQMSTPEPQG
jgi:hypothetical protein